MTFKSLSGEPSMFEFEYIHEFTSYQLNWIELGSVYLSLFWFLLKMKNGIWIFIFSFKFKLLFYVTNC